MRKALAFAICLFSFAFSAFANLKSIDYESNFTELLKNHHLGVIDELSCIESVKKIDYHPTVVVIHGFMSSHRSMKRIGYFLRCAGAEVYLWDYPSRKRTIREHGCHLVDLLNQIAKEKPGCPIYFVTHSVGGLILRAAFNNPNCPSEAMIGRAVLIAPPNQGAVLAHRLGKYGPVRAFMGKKSGRELICYHACDVQNLGSFPPCLDVLVLAGCKSSWDFLFSAPNDGFVTIEETRLETPHRHLVFKLTHSQLIQHSHILARVSRFIIHGYQKQEIKCVGNSY